MLPHTQRRLIGMPKMAWHKPAFAIIACTVMDPQLHQLLQQNKSYLSINAHNKIVCNLNGHELPPRYDAVEPFVRCFAIIYMCFQIIWNIRLPGACRSLMHCCTGCFTRAGARGISA